MDNVTRRSFIKGLGLSALGIGTGLIAPSAGIVRAQMSPSMMDVSAFYRFALGDFQITVIQDGTNALDQSIFGVNAPVEDVNAVLEANNLPTGVTAGTINIMLIDTGDRLVLIDTGQASVVVSEPFNAGKLLNTLALLGIDVSDVTDVILTHFHPDHIAAVSDGTSATFPNATYHIEDAELEFLAQDATGTPIEGFVGLANNVLQPIKDADQLSPFSGETELISGIQAVPSYGHTPGHTALMFNSNGNELFHMVDTANHWVLSLAHPEWVFGFDTIPEMAAETRRNNLERAASSGMQVFGYHFPFPGLGYVDTDGDGFRLITTA